MEQCLNDNMWANEEQEQNIRRQRYLSGKSSAKSKPQNFLLQEKSAISELNLFHDIGHPVSTWEVNNGRHQPVKQRKIESMQAIVTMNTFRKLYCEVQFNKDILLRASASIRSVVVED